MKTHSSRITVSKSRKMVAQSVRSFSKAAVPTSSAPQTEPTTAFEKPSHDGNTALNLYMREVGQVPLLTPQEEIELAARIKNGDEAARDQMIRANLRLVVKIARGYDGLGLPLLDLINEGNMGLMKAVERFDPAKGGKLSTYSSWWIRQSMRRALAGQGKTIRLPVYVVDQIYHLGRASMKLHREIGREPTEQELAAELGLSEARIAELHFAAMRPVSLDAPIGDDDSSRLSDLVPDLEATLPDAEMDGRQLTGLVGKLVQKLNTREATILRYRFGLDGGTERTLEEVGRKLGVTRERIRQLQNSALGKLKQMLNRMDTVSFTA